MTLLFLKSEDQYGIVDPEGRRATVGKKEYTLPPGSVLKAGDSVEIGGTSFTALNYLPAFNDILSDRTFQSIKPHDAAYMITMSGVRPGTNVLESGVGNGTFSAHLLWSISPHGSLTGVDVSQKALDSCRNTLSHFFDLSNWHPVKDDVKYYSSESVFDAVFLDIPDPWEAMRNARNMVKAGGTLTVYSPNYNQIEKSVLAMEKEGFEHIETVEILKRNILVREGRTRPDQRMLGHTAFISFGVRKTGFSLKLR